MAKKVVDLDALVATVEAAMRGRAALPAADLRLVRRHLPALRARLEALGLEVTSSQVRRPLLAQLASALDGGFVPAKELEKRVAGASVKEVKAAQRTLVDQGRARDVVRASGAGLVLASQARGLLIEQEDLAELLRHLANAQRLVKRAVAKKGARARPAVLRQDVFQALGDFGTPPRTPASAPPTDATALSQKIRARAEESALPLRVPELLRSLGADRESGKCALVEGASAGLFGLEPESGMARLTPADADWCPAGPQGTLLSWVVARHRGAGAR